MNHRALLLGILALLLNSGCIPIPIPHRVTNSPEISGTLLTEETGNPVGGVLVRVYGTELEARTDAAGNFRIPETNGWQYFWIIPLIPIGAFPRDSELVATLSGPTHADLEIVLRRFSFSKATTLIGDVGQENRDHPFRVGTIVVPDLEK